MSSARLEEREQRETLVRGSKCKQMIKMCFHAFIYIFLGKDQKPPKLSFFALTFPAI
jgi:hypothetical protein